MTLGLKPEDKQHNYDKTQDSPSQFSHLNNGLTSENGTKGCLRVHNKESSSRCQERLAAVIFLRNNQVGIKHKD